MAEAEEVAQTGHRDDVHLPSPSYWPILLCVSFPLIGYGLIFNLGFAFAGAFVLVLSIYGLALEPADDPDAHHASSDEAPAAESATEVGSRG